MGGKGGEEDLSNHRGWAQRDGVGHRGARAGRKTVDEWMQRIEPLAETCESSPPTQVGPTKSKSGLAYDSRREIGMAGADDAAGVYFGVGSVSERDYGDAHCDSRARSDHAESCGHQCFGGEQNASITGAAAARGGQSL